MAHVIILAFLLFIGKDAVGFVDLLELFFGPLIFADIRVIFTGEVAVGFLYFLVIGISRYSEDLVIIASITQSISTPVQTCTHGKEHERGKTKGEVHR